MYIRGKTSLFADGVLFPQQEEAAVADDMLDPTGFVLGDLFFNARLHQYRLEIAVLGVDALCLSNTGLGQGDVKVIIHVHELLLSERVDRAAYAGLAQIHVFRQLKGADRAIIVPEQQVDGFEVILFGFIFDQP